MLITKEQIIEAISNMSVLEINELILMIENKFKVTSITNNTNKNNELSLENSIKEKTQFNVILKSVGENKISVIKFIRSITNLGLKESKELVESCPISLKENLNKIEAEDIKNKLEDIGATIEII